METRIPTSEKLAQILELAQAPKQMIERARAGYYDDFKSELATPIVALAQDARKAGLPDIAQRAMAGEFDAQDWEADEWQNSEEGQETFRQFFLPKGEWNYRNFRR